MMKRHRVILVVVLFGMLLAGIALGQASAPPPAPAIRILAPNPGDKLAQSFVAVQYQLENPGLASGGFPNFSVQLDGRDPVVTAQTSQNFTGLAPGDHTIVVQLVDADGTPIAGARSEARFTITPPAAQPQPSRPPGPNLGAGLPQGDKDTITDSGETLPSASSALPLLSVIGFGALLGGILSALRTR